MEAIVCGVDPGLGTTGYAVVRMNGGQAAVPDAGVCRSDSLTPLPDRLASIERDIHAVLKEHRPRVVAVEELYSHYNHPRTAILMGHARGVILLAAGRLGVDVRSYSATRIKRYLTGNGRASKTQVQRAIQVTLGLTSLPEPPDVADALAIALCCAGDNAKRIPNGESRMQDSREAAQPGSCEAAETTRHEGTEARSHGNSKSGRNSTRRSTNRQSTIDNRQFSRGAP